ncbi:MAG: DUF4349 domain-containing protein [Acidobacteriota bacterium]
MASVIGTPFYVMAFVDGELSPTEAQAVAQHLTTCPDCTRLAEDLRSLTTQLQASPVETSTLTPETVLAAKSPRPRFFHGWKAWTLSAGLATASVLAIFVVSAGREHRYASPKMATLEHFEAPRPEPPASARSRQPLPDAKVPPSAGLTADKESAFAYAASTGATPPPPPVALPAESRSVSNAGMAVPHDDHPPIAAKMAIAPPPLQMIARSVNLDLEVANLTMARIAMQQTVSQHSGFVESLETTQGIILAAKLRVPAENLDATLADLRSLGKVTEETQSGEDVSAEHQDLAARLHNDRITETRLQDILTHRTGTVSDVLEVEQEIARVRGEIEQLQAEQQGLTRRVTYSTIELGLSHPAPPEPAASTTQQLTHALANGFRNLGSSLLTLVLFAEEYGPTLLLWAALLAIPAWLLIRRYRRLRSRA